MMITGINLTVELLHAMTSQELSHLERLRGVILINNYSSWVGFGTFIMISVTGPHHPVRIRVRTIWCYGSLETRDGACKTNNSTKYLFEREGLRVLEVDIYFYVGQTYNY